MSILGETPHVEPEKVLPQIADRMQQLDLESSCLTQEELEYFKEFQIRASRDVVGEVKKGSSEEKKQDRYLATFFHKLFNTEPYKWNYIIDHYLIYTLHNSSNFRLALLSIDWQARLYPMLNLAYPVFFGGRK